MTDELFSQSECRGSQLQFDDQSFGMGRLPGQPLYIFLCCFLTASGLWIRTTQHLSKYKINGNYEMLEISIKLSGCVVQSPISKRRSKLSNCDGDPSEGRTADSTRSTQAIDHWKVQGFLRTREELVPRYRSIGCRIHPVLEGQRNEIMLKVRERVRQTPRSVRCVRLVGCSLGFKTLRQHELDASTSISLHLPHCPLLPLLTGL